MPKFFNILAISLLLAGCSSSVGPMSEFHTTLYDQNWTPNSWMGENANPQDIIDGFYRAGIITAQESDGDIPVIEVGQAFLELSGQDKRRIITFMDAVYGITANNENGVIHIEHEDYRGIIGVYTQDGLNMI